MHQAALNDASVLEARLEAAAVAPEEAQSTAGVVGACASAGASHAASAEGVTEAREATGETKAAHEDKRVAQVLPPAVPTAIQHVSPPPNQWGPGEYSQVHQ